MSWFYATLIVGLAYLLIGAAAAFFAYSEITKASLTPERTIRVLKQDQVWLQRESNDTATELKEDISVRRAA
jgi:CRISPR/Cas system-associated protein Csm6